MQILIPLVFIAAFVAVLAWVIRYSRAQAQARRAQLSRLGFRWEKRPAEIARFKEVFGDIEDEIHYRDHVGYAVWFLQKRDSEGPSQPFLAVVFERALFLPAEKTVMPAWQAVSPTHAALQGVWIIPAFAEQGGLAHRALGFLAKLGGYPHRLPLSSFLARRFEAYARHPAWTPAPHPDFFRELETVPSMSIRGVPAGLLIEAQPDPGSYRTPPADALLTQGMILAVERVSEAVLRK